MGVLSSGCCSLSLSLSLGLLLGNGECFRLRPCLCFRLRLGPRFRFRHCLCFLCLRAKPCVSLCLGCSCGSLLLRGYSRSLIHCCLFSRLLFDCNASSLTNSLLRCLPGLLHARFCSTHADIPVEFCPSGSLRCSARGCLWCRVLDDLDTSTRKNTFRFLLTFNVPTPPLLFSGTLRDDHSLTLFQRQVTFLTPRKVFDDQCCRSLLLLSCDVRCGCLRWM